jgi:ABC-type amino acid transport substrate-binding protein
VTCDGIAEEVTMTARPLAAALALIALLAASARGAELAEIEKRGTLKVLAVPGSEQFFSLAGGGPHGFDREILDGFAHLRKLRLEPVSVASWDALVPALVEGRADLAAGGVTATDGRRRTVDFTAEVFPSRMVAMTRKPTPPVESLAQLRALKVGTIRGTSLAAALKALSLPSVDDGVPSGGLPEALHSGRVTAIVMGVEDAIEAQRKDPAIQVGLFVGPKASLAFAVPKSAPRLRQALDDYIANLRHTSTWSRLVVQYFGESTLEILQKAQEN